MSKFIINYGTGAGNEETSDFELAMETADNGAAYTQQNIKIEDENGNVIAQRTWYGTICGIEECENPISFGTFGFYADWVII